AVWRYRDDGSDQGTNWIRPDFDDSSWASGGAPLGFGASGVRFPATTNTLGHATYYYRHTFVVTNVAGLSYLEITLERDDGSIVYLNGREIDRDNMRSGPVTYADYALQPAFDDGQIAWFIYAEPSSLVEGTNTLAVEIHQDIPLGADLWFRMNMAGEPRFILNLEPMVSITSPTNGQYYLAPPNI